MFYNLDESKQSDNIFRQPEQTNIRIFIKTNDTDSIFLFLTKEIAKIRHLMLY